MSEAEPQVHPAPPLEHAEEPPKQTTHQIPPLPHVVWRCIASHLSNDLETLLHIASFSPDLQDVCRPHISAFFQTITRPMVPLPSDFYYHRLLQLILEGYLDPASIYEFYCLADYSGSAPQRFFGDTTHQRVGTKERQMIAFDQLLDGAVRASPYIPLGMHSKACTCFQCGDPDAALAVLLPLCTKLKILEIPVNSDLCATVVQNIAQEYQRQGVVAEDARRRAWTAASNDHGETAKRHRPPTDALPFSELLVLYTRHDGSETCSFGLASLTPYMGLPSLHRIVLEAVRDHSFPGWPADVVKCSCSEVYFQQSSVTKRTALAFAQGMMGPCEIRQWFEWDAHFDDGWEEGNPLWDRILVKRDEDGSKSVEARLEFEGGNPGYEHDWVSWLYHGKMMDWRRLDEGFSLQAGDEDVDWLCGCFA